MPLWRGNNNENVFKITWPFHMLLKNTHFNFSYKSCRRYPQSYLNVKISILDEYSVGGDYLVHPPANGIPIVEVLTGKFYSTRLAPTFRLNHSQNNIPT